MKLQEKLEQWRKEKKAIFVSNLTAGALVARIIEVGDNYVVVEGVSLIGAVLEEKKISFQKVTIPFTKLEIREGKRAKPLLERAEAMISPKK